MARDRDDRLFVIAGYLAVIAAGAIVISMQAPPTDDTLMALVGAARFVVAVAAGILGFITWFDRRYPVIELRAELVELDSPSRRA